MSQTMPAQGKSASSRIRHESRYFRGSRLAVGRGGVT